MQIHFPVTVQLFGKEFFLHSILETLSIFIAMRYYYFLKRKSIEKTDLIVSLAVLLGATAGGVIGSKLIGNLEDPFHLFSDEITINEFWFSNTITGGLAFGLIGVEMAKKTVNHTKSTGDLMVFPLILALFIGRIGCFSMGVFEETYGLPSNSFFAMNLGDQILRHPVTLYEMFFLIVLTVFLLFIKRQRFYYSGLLFQIFMFCYFIFRFFLDFIKPRVVFFGNLGTIQLLCLFVIFYYIYTLSVKFLKVKKYIR